MDDEWWEGPVCYICNYWWVLLLVIVLLVAAYFTKGYWMPALGLGLASGQLII